MKKIKTILSAVLMLLFFTDSTFSKELIVNKILELEINSSINPATLNYLKSGYMRAEKENFQMVLIKLNTPGGLVSTTKSILALFGKSNLITSIWVTPEGGSATSAGAIIASGAHILVMNEGTNIGAATPIQLQGEVKNKDLRMKAINDLVALVQSLSEARGRNGKLFGEMVEKASSFKSKEALKANLIDSIIHSNKEFLQFINNKNVHVKGVNYKILSTSAYIVKQEMDYGQKLLNIFADPNMIYVLLLIGAALIYLEIQAPGGFIAGSIGVVCLILSGIGLQILPLNFGAFGLILLSFFLFILEAYIISYGVITLIGLASLTAGSLFLFRTDNTYIELSRELIFSSVSAIAIFLLLIAYIFLKDIRKGYSTNFNKIIDREGVIMSIVDKSLDGVFYYQVKISGEIWNAYSDKEYKVGEHIVVQEVKDNMQVRI